MAVKIVSQNGLKIFVTLHSAIGQQRPTRQTQNFRKMKPTSAKNNPVSKNAAKQQVNNANTTRRVVETRDQWDVIFNHAVSLVVAYTRGQKPEEPRKGFGFGLIGDQPHSRAYAQSLLVGFLTGKAGKALKGFDELASRESREKIAIAILLDTKLAKDGTEGAKRIMAKAEPKREKAFAEAVLTGLNTPAEQPATPEGVEDKAEEPKATAPKGSKAKGGKKATTPKGGKAKAKTQTGKAKK